MEVKIGVTDNPRELVIASQDSAADVEARVTDALRDGQGLLTLSDEKGRRFVVPAAKISYVEIGMEGSSRVGFSA